MNKQRRRSEFLELAEQAVAASHTSEVAISGPITDSLVVRGGLFLQGAIADQYQETVTSIQKEVGQQGAWSRTSVDEILAAHLTEVLQTPDAPRTSLQQIADKLLLSLSKSLTSYTVKISVFDLHSDVNGTEFGQLKFVLGRAQSIFASKALAPVGQDFDLIYAHVDVQAIDSKSAMEQGSVVVQRHLLIMNALLSESPPSYVRLSQSFSATHSATFVEVSEAVSGIEGSKHRQSQLLSRRINRTDIESHVARIGASRLARLLDFTNRFTRRVSSALEIAGSACVSTESYVSFLLLAVALESAVMGNQNSGEITHQLAVRAAFLFSKTLKGRLRLYTRLKKLYAVRSKVVHSGLVQISEGDLEAMRHICLACLGSLIMFPEFEAFTQSEQLDEWFTAKALEGVPSSAP